MGCKTPQAHRAAADKAAYSIISEKQADANLKDDPIYAESAELTLRNVLIVSQKLSVSGSESLGFHNLPANKYWNGTDHIINETPQKEIKSEIPVISLVYAIQVAAANNPDFQTAKEKVFRTALSLDLTRNDFRTTFAGFFSSLLESNRSATGNPSGSTTTAEGRVTKKLESGTEITQLLALNLAKLLTGDRSSALGLLADTTVTIPLLGGAGKDIVTENLKQAEMDMIYALHEFEQYKKTFAFDIANVYLNVLVKRMNIVIAEENYTSLIAESRRSRSLADSGRITELQYDDAYQKELSARTRWIESIKSYESNFDALKLKLGLPPDAELSLDESEISNLQLSIERFTVADSNDTDTDNNRSNSEIVLKKPTHQNAGPYEIEFETAIQFAFDNRLDLKSLKLRIVDAQRKIMVAVDSLQPKISLTLSSALGESRSMNSASKGGANLDPTEGIFSTLLSLDLPFDKTAERIQYRNSVLDLQRAVRDFQVLEDNIKLCVLDRLRDLTSARENLLTQVTAMNLAEKRVKSAEMFFQAGRAEISDLLDAQDALVTSRNALIAAAAAYKIAEIQFQKDLGILNVDNNGVWVETNLSEIVKKASE